MEREKHNEKLEHLSNVSKTDLAITVNFLHDFHEATVMLSKSREPTIVHVWPMLDRLRNTTCKPATTDSVIICGLKSAFAKSLKEKYLLHPIHRYAAVLCPAFKHLALVKPEVQHMEISGMRYNSRW